MRSVCRSPGVMFAGSFSTHARTYSRFLSVLDFCQGCFDFYFILAWENNMLENLRKWVFLFKSMAANVIFSFLLSSKSTCMCIYNIK